MNRRTILKIVALSALATRRDAQGADCSMPADKHAAWTAGNYHLQFFTPAENDLLDQAMEIIIPADHQSGGAQAAKVSLFADRMLSVESDAGKSKWRGGLQLVQEEAAKSSLADALARAAVGEANPQNGFERFFVALKQMTVNGYYSSEIGIHQDLQYQGNTYVAEFPHCARR